MSFDIKCNSCKKGLLTEEFDIKKNGEICKTCKDCVKKRSCIHNKRKSRCKECGGKSLCIHDKDKSHCKVCNEKYYCTHSKEKNNCSECNPKVFCSHNIRKTNCKNCNPDYYCSHNKKGNCKDCNQNYHCIHDKVKRTCKDCNPNYHCEHNRIKRTCVECGGSSTCIHLKIKKNCKICEGTSVCIHSRRKNYCVDCLGTQICTHQKQKNTCVLCKGTQICKNCRDWPDARIGCKKYDGYCATCFKNIFPTDSRSTIIRSKSKEIVVRNFLAVNNPEFIHDVSIYTGNCDCTHRRRIDHRVLIGNTILAVETDERQHSSYDKKDEEIRYDDLYMIHSGKWIFIRFNPDSYQEKGIRKNPDLKKRLPVLLEEIERHIARIKNEENTDLVEIHKLYYNR